MPSIKKRILVAEDEKAIARALELKLKHSGYDVEVVHDGASAVEKVRLGSLDLLLLDLVMPKMDGFKVLETLQKEGLKIPVIVTSNLSQEEDVKRAKSLGAVDYLVKSNTPLVEILSRIQSFLK